MYIYTPYIYKGGSMTCLHVYTCLINVDMPAIIGVNMWAYDMLMTCNDMFTFCDFYMKG